MNEENDNRKPEAERRLAPVSLLDGKELKPLDVIACVWLHHEGPNVVIPHKERGLLLAPLTFVDMDDDADFSNTHKKAAHRSIKALEGKDWYLVGRLERKWVMSGPRR